MKIILTLMLVIGLAGCAKPYGPAEIILNQQLVTPNVSEPQTKITVTRLKQFTGGINGGVCKFIINIDGDDVALLRQNQFITAYIKNGTHKLQVSNDCGTLSMGMRKTLDIIADGTTQEYVTETGMWGQYRMWRTK
ncbi:hypothetical protein DVQ40_19475 [Yersinia enterocolitica]|uniref:hypothetical protein n=1 Tax=Yersinia enterocolitica TaxID=630 RepID=UPI002813400D|nr:hypothetical protein [Yersinia enterocolitica]EKN5104224.1 hypothetical protein [Yersinia enterocolitica]EKN6090238.1 hypothetical protein [Yersinia enterocolitica]EKN6245946.1 hypothetical protein [Yersinia enterocolitica]HDL8430542.1 hypothetical protein [Yersinia enterocolitica]